MELEHEFLLDLSKGLCLPTGPVPYSYTAANALAAGGKWMTDWVDKHAE